MLSRIFFVYVLLGGAVFAGNMGDTEPADLDVTVIAETFDTPEPEPRSLEIFSSKLSDDMHDSEEQIPQVPKLPPGVTLDTSPPSTTSTTTTVPLPDGKCSEWYDVALDAGWERDELTKIGRIVWAESRCDADATNKTYSYGLLQIEWSAHEGWLETEFGITERADLYDPYTNFVVGRWLFDYADRNYGCGWQPWYMSGDWC